MSADEGKKLVSRVADELWNQGRLETVEEVMTAEAHYHGPHMPNGVGTREDWRQAVARYRSAFPDARVTYEELIACGDTIVGRWSATGTQRGPMPGAPPSGKRIAISGITIYRIAGGKIVEAWEQLDLLGMWQQLGVFAPPGHGAVASGERL